MFKKITAMLMVMVLSAGVGYAAGNGKSITVYYDTIKKIMINNQDKTPTDVKPFIYQGTTYVPLRYISEQLGEPVYYDNATQIIYIGEKPRIANIERTELFTVPFAGIYKAYLYRLNNSLAQGDNLDLDALYDYPRDYKMTYRISNTGTAYDFVELSRGLSSQVSFGETNYYFNIGQSQDVLTGVIGYDGKLNPKIYDCTVNVIVDDVVRQQIKLNATNLKDTINATVTGGKILKLQLLVDNYQKIENLKMEPFLNLTEMTLEKISYK